MSTALLCLVIAIADGDTLTARCPEQTIKIRLAEIDAPEKAQPFGARSKQSLSDLCFKVEATILAEKRDRYGRTVAHVTCNGKDAGAAQIQAGMAWVYTQYSTDAALPPMEAEARAAGLGLWVDPSPTPPWLWRRTPHH